MADRATGIDDRGATGHKWRRPSPGASGPGASGLGALEPWGLGALGLGALDRGGSDFGALRMRGQQGWGGSGRVAGSGVRASRGPSCAGFSEEGGTRAVSDHAIRYGRAGADCAVREAALREAGLRPLLGARNGGFGEGVFARLQGEGDGRFPCGEEARSVVSGHEAGTRAVRAVPCGGLPFEPPAWGRSSDEGVAKVTEDFLVVRRRGVPSWTMRRAFGRAMRPDLRLSGRRPSGRGGDFPVSWFAAQAMRRAWRRLGE